MNGPCISFSRESAILHTAWVPGRGMAGIHQYTLKTKPGTYQVFIGSCSVLIEGRDVLSELRGANFDGLSVAIYGLLIHAALEKLVAFVLERLCLVFWSLQMCNGNYSNIYACNCSTKTSLCTLISM